VKVTELLQIPEDLFPTQPAELPLPEIQKASEMLAKPRELPPLVIHGVLHKGLKAVLGSGSKARKTWILLDVALSVATGTNWWNWATTKGKVVYINFEIPEEFLWQRIQSLCEKKEIDFATVDGLDVWNLRGRAESLGKLVPKIVSRVQAEGYSLIIIDPIYKCLGGRDENAAGDIAELCNELERIAVQTGAAVFYASHFSKGNQAAKEAIDRIGGSGVWTRDADTIITLTQHKEESLTAFTVDMILRNLPEPESFVVSWDFPLMTPNKSLDPNDLKQKGGRTSKYEPSDVLEVLGKNRLKTNEWKKLAAEEGISPSTFYRLKRTLKDTGRIAPNADDTWVSAEGQRAEEQAAGGLLDPKALGISAN
jgi:hypothetical protein